MSDAFDRPPNPAARSCRSLVAALVALVASTLDPAAAQNAVRPTSAGAGNAFGTRDPRPCPTVASAPSKAQAEQLVACFREAQSSNRSEVLVESPIVASMTPSRYDPRTQTGFVNMDTTTAPIAIRGSLVAWACRPIDGSAVAAKYSNVGQNCDRQIERNAIGYCYRMRTGAWTCAMNGVSIADADREYRLAPPREESAVTAPAPAR